MTQEQTQQAKLEQIRDAVGEIEDAVTELKETASLFTILEERAEAELSWLKPGDGGAWGIPSYLARNEDTQDLSHVIRERLGETIPALQAEIDKVTTWLWELVHDQEGASA